MWVLRSCHDGRRDCAARASAEPERGRDPRGPLGSSLSVRLASANPPCSSTYELTLSASDPKSGTDHARSAGDSSLGRNPELDTWIRIDEAETVTIFTGKVEIGQGISRALARVAAEELDVGLGRINVRTADTGEGPDEIITAGSLSMSQSGSSIRQAAAEARSHLLALAATELGADVGTLSVDDGTVTTSRGASITYWQLLGGRRFEVPVRGDVTPKQPEEYRVVGRSGPSDELVALVTGTARFLDDLAPPGMLHARVLHPPSQSAVLIDADVEAAAALPGIAAVIRNGGFVGVVGEREENVIHAHGALEASASWEERDALPEQRELAAWLLEQPTEDYLVVGGAPVDGPVPVAEPAPANASATIEATFTRAFQMHGSIGPSSALAEWRGGALTVWSHSQAVHMVRPALAQALGMEQDDIRVVHVRGAGCYGHNGADDAAFEAALLARAVPDRPVLLKWTRSDEHGSEPYAPPGVVRTRASLDGEGRLLAWDLDAWGTTHNARPFPFGERTGFAAAWRLDPPVPREVPGPLLLPEAGIHRNATPIYDVPAKRIVKHFIRAAPLRTSSTRALGAYVNVFAIEALMDDLARAAGSDPLDFRLSHLEDERARAVLLAAAERAGWGPADGELGRGSGLAFARYKNSAAYAAVVVDVSIADDTAQISVDRVVIGADAGQVVDPSGLMNQLEGGAVQSISWTLYEEVGFDRTRVTSLDWDSYPILRFDAVPEIETVLVDRPGAPYLGAGEATQGPTAAAIGNAVRAALGVRLYDLPLTPDRVRDAVAAL